MAQLGISNIRLYTERYSSLSVGTTQLQIHEEKVDRFYVVTPDQFKTIVSDITIRPLLFKNEISLTIQSLTHLIRYTNVETVKYFIDTLVNDGVFEHHEFCLFENMDDAVQSVDNRMWKYIIDTHSNLLHVNKYLHAVIRTSKDDSLIDIFINICKYVKLKDMLANNTVADDLIGDSLVYHCINNNNYKILKYLLNLCDKQNVYLDIGENLLETILARKEEYVDLLLKYAKSKID